MSSTIWQRKLEENLKMVKSYLDEPVEYPVLCWTVRRKQLGVCKRYCVTFLVLLKSLTITSFPGSPRTRSGSQLSLRDHCEINSASSTPDFFQNRSFRHNETPRPFTRFGSVIGADRQRPALHQSPQVATSAVSGGLNSMKSGLRKAGSLSSIMDKFRRSGEGRRESRPQIEIIHDNADDDNDARAEGPGTLSRWSAEERFHSQSSEAPMLRSRKDSPSLLSIMETKEPEGEFKSKTLPKPKTKFLSGLRKMSNSLRRKSRRKQDDIKERDQDVMTQKEMVETNDTAQSSNFEYADTNDVDAVQTTFR